MHYHFGIPGEIIWAIHIIIGLFFIYVGFISLNGKNLGQIISIIFIVLGVIMSLYHSHIWLLPILNKQHEKKHKN